MKRYDDSRINTILANLELDMKKDDEYNYRNIDNDFTELYRNIDKVVEYVSSGYKGKLYLNSNIWQPCYESLSNILKIYNLRFMGSDKVSEQEEVINVNDYIKNMFKKFNITSDTPDDLIQGYYLSIKGLSPDSVLKTIEEKRNYLYGYILDYMEKNYDITHEQRIYFEKEYLGIDSNEMSKDYNNVQYNTDIEIGTIFRFDNYVCKVDDSNFDNPNESIVYIYESQQSFENGEYKEQISLLNKDIKENINEYMEENYGVKPITKIGLLKEMQNQICNDLLTYSKNYLMTSPKNGYEQEWKIAKEKYDLINQMIKDERSNNLKNKKEEMER